MLILESRVLEAEAKRDKIMRTICKDKMDKISLHGGDSPANATPSMCRMLTIHQQVSHARLTLAHNEPFRASRGPWHSDPKTDFTYGNIALSVIHLGQKVLGPMLEHIHTVLLASRIYWLFLAFAIIFCFTDVKPIKANILRRYCICILLGTSWVILGLVLFAYTYSTRPRDMGLALSTVYVYHLETGIIPA
jgi:hypothetical protein